MLNAMTNTSPRRYEPDRRARIIETALVVIAEHGVAGTTHRRVAEAANVPLGSMTYHFSGITDLVAAAFEQLSLEISARYSAALNTAQSRDEAREVVVQLICGGLWASERNMVLQFELYAYMARNDRLRKVVADWTARSHQALERHFDPMTARALDALVEGVTIHNFVRSDVIPIEEVRVLVRKLTNPDL